MYKRDAQSHCLKMQIGKEFYKTHGWYPLLQDLLVIMT